MRKYLRMAVLAGVIWISLLPVSAQYDLDPANKFTRALEWILRYYVDSVNTSKLVEDAIIGMLKDLDPHTVYMNRDEVRQMNEPLQGNFEGIGVSFYLLEDTILVIKPVPEGPSDKVGIKAGDKIITINGENVAGIGLTNDGVFERLRGPRGTTVTVGIKRQGEPQLLQFKIQRDKIPIFSLDAAYMISPGVGYIKINRFAATTSREFADAFKTLKSKGMTRLVLDLGQNGGGYLEEAIRLADFFLSKNKLILYTQGLRSPRQDFIATSYGEFEKGDMVIVIDENSASASEIVAGAIQDWDRGLIVGRRSFGKGLVQRPVPLPDGSLIRLTVARYYTPTGRSIQKPYKDGIDAYEQDLIKRYQHGEFIHADSIRFPDSLKYYTLEKKRTVYGGGGIMPDIFVPLDTSSYSSYYRSLMNSGILYRFVVRYIDRNRRELTSKYPSFELFEKNFSVTSSILDQLTAYAEAQKLPPDPAGMAASGDQIRLLVKAYIARDLFDTNEFFQIYNQSDKTVQKAVEVISSMSKYW